MGEEASRPVSPWRVLVVVAVLALPGGLVVLGLRWLRRQRRAEIVERMSATWRKTHQGDTHHG